jgi:hypothetical protein
MSTFLPPNSNVSSGGREGGEKKKRIPQDQETFLQVSEEGPQRRGGVALSAIPQVRKVFEQHLFGVIFALPQKARKDTTCLLFSFT